MATVVTTQTVFTSPYKRYAAAIGSSSSDPVSGTEGIATNTIRNVVAAPTGSPSGANTQIIVEYNAGTERKRGYYLVNRSVTNVISDINA